LRAGESLESVQFTLVDCPGHASLIRTIIGGAQIIDMMMLVIVCSPLSASSDAPRAYRHAPTTPCVAAKP
jgi:translation initiation factor 2 gamma subunit (eIF-2gamma)